MSWIVEYRNWLPEVTTDGMDLESNRLIVIPPLCAGRIPHDGKLVLENYSNGTPWIVRKQGTLLACGLIVDQGPVGEGELWTEVWNVSAHETRIRKGESVSRLVLVRGVV